MIGRRDPPRWLDEPGRDWPRGFRDALAGYASTGPSAIAAAKIAERVEAGLPVQPMAAALWTRFGAGGLVAVAALAGWFVYAHLTRPSQRVETTAAPAPVAAPSRAAEPQATEPAAHGGTTRDVEPAEPIAPAGPARANASLQHVTRTAVRPAAKIEPTTREDAIPRASSPGDPRAELELLIRARSVVTVSPARTLELVKRHAAVYPSTTFEEEREVLAIEAERRLGHTKAAAERTRRFLQTHPSSIHRPEVEESARGE